MDNTVSISFQNTSGFAHHWEIIDVYGGLHINILIGVDQTIGPYSVGVNENSGDGTIRYRKTDQGDGQWQQRDWVDGQDVFDLY